MAAPYCWDEDLSGTKQPFGGTVPNKLMEDLRDQFGTVFNAVSLGVDNTGTTDVVPALRDAQSRLADAGGGTLYFPRGTYTLGSYTDIGNNLQYQVAIVSDNVKWVFDPKAVLVEAVESPPAGLRPLMIMGHGKNASLSDWTSTETIDATVYALSGSASMGAVTLPAFSNIAHAANFAVGDFVFVRTGSTLANAAVNPDCEVNQVAAVDTGTGVLTLEWPLLKDYAAENYNSGSSGVSSVGGGGNAAPFGVANITDRTLENITLDGIRIHTTNDIQTISVWGVVGFEMRNSILKHKACALGSRDTRFVRITNNRFHHKGGFISNSAYATGPSTGCGVWYITNNMITSPTKCYIHMHEGVTRAVVQNNTIYSAEDGGQTTPLISIRARAYDIDITGNFLSFNGDTVPDGLIYIDDACPGGGIISNNTFRKPAAANDIRCDSPNWELGPQRHKDIYPQISMRPGFSLAGVYGFKGTVLTLAISLSSSKLSGTMGVLPKEAIPLRVNIRKSQGFNSDGTDLINVGYTGVTNAYISNYDCAATGTSPNIINAGTAAGAWLGLPTDAARTVIATYTPGGSAASQGQIHIVMEYLISARVT